jgi:hypothetical protein
MSQNTTIYRRANAIRISIIHTEYDTTEILDFVKELNTIVVKLHISKRPALWFTSIYRKSTGNSIICCKDCGKFMLNSTCDTVYVPKCTECAEHSDKDNELQIAHARIHALEQTVQQSRMKMHMLKGALGNALERLDVLEKAYQDSQSYSLFDKDIL